MKRVTDILIFGFMTLLFAGCTAATNQPAAKSEDVWNEEIQEMADSGQTYKPAGNGVVFFNKNKPRLKTVQIWLESGKTVSAKIKEYIAGIMPGKGASGTSLAQKIAGRWYGLDTNHESAVVFTFEPDGRFVRQAGDEIETGRYEFEPAADPDSITFTPQALPGGRSRQFEFITDDALLFKGGHRDLILFKQS
ncbi:MAG: hypothetical protein HUN04_03690 [Desulfobacter sp.]|nr:MAG: hypothetical protein HUN04_03690 [Desulfobacter sp.]